MEITVLTTDLVYQSFILAAKNVIKEKKLLNDLNVFPVADSDTGNNLASLMASIIEKAQKSDNLNDTLNSISNAAIYGAKGNSGIIFAQYIQGFSEQARSNQITMEEFSVRLEEAFQRAYEAILHPVEGTIITLMRIFSQTVKKLLNKSANFADLLNKSYEELLIELDKTPEKLQVLKDNKVIDAGAKGFVLFIEGFIKALEGTEIELSKEYISEISEQKGHIEKSSFRYCTEALIKNDHKMSASEIRQELSQLGDSLVVANTSDYIRVHIHSDNPEKVFNTLSQKGLIVEQKIDDMKRQYEVANKRKNDIALVTDSIADLPKELIDKYQIHVLPATITINEMTYFDKLSITNEKIYKNMEEKDFYPSSSQPNIKVIENLLKFLNEYYKEIIILSVSSKMSGTYQVFSQVVKNLKLDKVTLVDSKRNSGAEGLLVLKTALMIDNKMSKEKILEELEKDILKSQILVSVKNLKYMVRSGRLTKTKGLLVKLLNVKPIVKINNEGIGEITDKAFSIKKANQKLLDMIRKVHQEKEIIYYNIVHADALDRVKEYEKELISIIGTKPNYITEISSVIAMNSGIGSIAVSYITKK
ncbi:DegV family protein with Dak phosphatase domain [Alteracholeplasma palmae J233]|uniref:DegV family protein with Dak phosphatase domain n=1 Tax=Alteracholeplasma palmae (strain ATCC 49389 / J233) TaxID=1318466 RepID=U4KKR1_ALTPJ|nr:DegV family protein [Alteracholeplasma palmae]CCV64257.1 DegV family protein with Dak phosphatase domain [Alteracholeplasma palmae J233]